MHTFRRSLRQSRLFILSFLLLETFYMVQGWNFVHAYQEHGKKQERLKEISEILDIPVEDLQPHSDGLYEQVRGLFVDDEDPVKAAGQERLREVLRKHEEQIANNPYRPQMEAVEQAHRLHRIEGSVNDLLQLTDPRNGKALARGAQRALLRNLHHGLKDGLELPALRDGLPAKAQERQRAMQSKLDALVETVQPAVRGFDGESMGTKAFGSAGPTGTVAQKVEQLRLFQAGAERKRRAPRFQERPLPNVLVVEKARVGDARSVGPTPPVQLKNPDAAQKSTVDPSTVDPAIIDPAIIALADALDHSPAAFYRYVLEEIAFDPKWGATKSPRGTLDEKLGTSWDQAWLLQQLLIASGVDARFEWGTVEITAEQLTNLVGIDDPWRAGDLLTTAGNPVVLVTEGSRVRTVRMQHAWVVAHLDYIPNRGVTPGPGDTWIRMDPTLVSMQWTDGLDIHAEVPFALEDYLLSGTEQSPRRYYEDALWSHIRANGIECATLDQLKRSGSVEREGVPFVPGTLRATVLDVAGQSATVPVAQQHQLTLSVRRASDNAELLAWSSPWPAVYGQRLELAWPGATADDTATLEAYGGVFETPPYLVELAPEIRLDGTSVARGSSLGSAEDVEVFATLSSPMANAEPSLFQLAAGEPANFLVDYGHVPQSQVDTHRQSQLAASTDGNSELEDASTLALLGAQYLRNLGRDLADLGGWKRQRVVQLGTLGMTVQTGSVTTAVGGSPLTFTKNNRVIDIATMPLGLFPVDGSTNPEQVASLELLGSQSSYLEGEIFEEVIAHGGISAVTFLTHAVREGQTITRVDGSNVDAVLSAIDLGDDVEASIRDGIAQGKIAWVPESELTIRQWRGTGYVIEDPSTGAAGYLGTGGYGAGGDTGGFEKLKGIFGSEAWLGSPFAALFGDLLGILGLGGEEPTTIVSDPVNLSNGNMIHYASDLSIMARGLPIQWDRTYNSQSDHVGPFGHGWTFTYGETLEPQADGSMLYREEDGTEHTFEVDASGGWTSPPGKHLTLTAAGSGGAGSGHTLRTKDGTVLTFGASGRLDTVADRNGNTVTLGYDASGHLETVTDAAGRWVLTVTVDNGKITAIEDLTGRRVTYGYVGHDLVSVTDVAGEVWHLGYDGTHNLVSITDPLGHSDTFGYDSLDRCIRHVDALGAVETFAYASQGQRAVMTDRRGFTSYWEMDERGRATRKVDPLGNVIEAAWDTANNRTATMDPRGGVTTRTWDENGNMLSETDALGNTTTYTYEPTFNQVTSQTDALGHTTTLVYDGAGNMIEQRQTVGGETLVTTVTYDAFGRTLEQTDPMGNTTTMAYAPDPALDNGVFVSQTDPLGHTTTYATDPLGRITGFADPEGNTIAAAVDARGNPVSIVDWFGNETTLSYDAKGRSTSMGTALGVRSTELDAKGRVVTQVDVLGHRSTVEYDSAGNTIASTDANGHTTSILYDALGRRTAVIDPLGHVWTLGYCGELGQASGCAGGSCSGDGGQATFCDVTDPLGNTSKQEVDALGRVVRTTDPQGNSSTVTYDARGQQTAMTNALGHTTSYEYDLLGRLSAVVEANGARTEYRYDKNGNLVERIDAEGHRWRQEFDALDRLVREIDPLGNGPQYVYDGLGNLSRMIDANGDEIRYEYRVNLLERQLDAQGQVLNAWTYDTFGRRTTAVNAEAALSFEYDAMNRPVRVVHSTLGETLEYTYDASGQRQTMVGPEGTVGYTYDGRGQLVSISDPKVGQYRFEYDAVGRRSRLIRPNDLETAYAYSSAHQLESLISRNSGEILDGYAYQYDALQRRISSVDLRDEVQESYTYDAVGRLLEWTNAQGSVESYAYDLRGNRAQLTTPHEIVSYTYDASGRLLESDTLFTNSTTSQAVYAWDARGQQLSKTEGGVPVTMEWNVLGQLTGITRPGQSSTFGYDPLGARVRRTSGTANERFLLDHFGQGGYAHIIQVQSDQPEDTQYILHGSRVDEPLAMAKGVKTTTLLQDGLGSVTMTATVGEGNPRYRYSAFGASIGEEPSLFGYTGRVNDSGGLYHYRSRYYTPENGRFASRDIYRGRAAAPGSQNRYTYVENDPVNHVDPSGMVLSRVLGLSLAYASYRGIEGTFGYLAQETLAFAFVEEQPFTTDGWLTSARITLAKWAFGLTVLSLLAYFIAQAFVAALFLGPRSPLAKPPSDAVTLGKMLEDAIGQAKGFFGNTMKAVLLSVVCAYGLRTFRLSAPFDLGAFVGKFMGGCIVGSIILYSRMKRKVS